MPTGMSVLNNYVLFKFIKTKMNNLDKLFDPQSVAIVGVSEKKAKLGGWWQKIF